MRRLVFSAATVGLGIGWLLVPGLQYVGTVVRTDIQLQIATGQRTQAQLQGSEISALLNLTPYYMFLLIATLVLVAFRALAARRSAGTE